MHGIESTERASREPRHDAVRATGRLRRRRCAVERGRGRHGGRSQSGAPGGTAIRHGSAARGASASRASPRARMPYPHELPSAHQPRRGGPAAPRSTHAHAPGVTPGDHPSAPNRPVTRKPPVTGGNEGFSGHAGRNGGFGGAGGAWGESRRPPDPPRWRVGHDAVDRATASGAVRGAAAPDPNQRTVRTMFAAKEPQQHAGAKQRTLDDAFGDKRNARAASAAVVARSMRPDVSRPSFPETHSEAPPPDAHAHLRPIDLEDDWDVDRWARSEARAPRAHAHGSPRGAGSLIPRARRRPWRRRIWARRTAPGWFVA